MGRYFKNDLFDDFAGWLRGYTATGGPDIGVLEAVGAAVGDGDAAAFNAAWMAEGDRFAAEAATMLAAGRTGNARRLLFWAAACYATSYHPLYGAPVDPRLLASFRRQIETFERALALLPHPVKPLRIPYEATTLPGYFLPATGREEAVRPLVILTNGYDGSVTEMYLAEAAGVAARGYHCLFFDGPGQGEMLIEQGVPMRPDWEAVVRPVVDFALTLPGIDPARIALWGWSLGGYLALRGASGEPRLAACVADPGLRAVMTPQMLARFGVKDAAGPGTAVEAALEAAAKASPRMHWSLMQRGLWVHGVASLGDYATAAMAMTLEGRVGMIGCPTLLTTAENDPLSHGAEALLAELSCPKALLRFTAAEGAGDHCEMGNRSLAMMRIVDWLDDTLG